MTHYRSNVRDIEFNLFEVLDRESILGTGTVRGSRPRDRLAILAEADQLARTKLAETFADGDHEPPVFDPKTHYGDVAGGVQEVLPTLHGLRRLAAWSCPPSSAASHARPRCSGRSTS